MRVGRLERVQPIFLLIETPKRTDPSSNRQLAAGSRGKRSAWEEAPAMVGPRQEGRKPWRAENPREDRLQSCG